MRKRDSLTILAAVLTVLFAVSPAAFAEKSDDDAEIEVKIGGLGFDRLTNTPVVLLTDEKKKTVIPIWIGLCEARSIEIGLSGLIPPRPLTYDMVAAIIRTLNGEVKKVVITDLRDRVYYARVMVSVKGKVSGIDARPSDAIALASRMNSPIYVTKSVMEKAAVLDTEVEEREL